MKRWSRLPDGISDYKMLIDRDYIYVDKTKYIKLLEKTKSYAFFLRPRRFGKSLFSSVLEYYYDINCEGEFEYLYGNTYIGQNPTEEKNQYYVLKFNFTGLTTDAEESLLDSFRMSTLISYRNFCVKYGLHFEYLKEGAPADILNDFVSQFRNHVDGQIYFIIDEYDHFANELLSFRTELFSGIVSKTGFVRKWYEKIKDHTGTGTIARFFATGVSPITNVNLFTLDSLTSGFNIATDLTRWSAFNEMMGFTEDEIRGLIEDTLKDGISTQEKERIVNEMRSCYNGYLFHHKGALRVFNSSMSLNYLSEYFNSGRPPEELLDSSIASDYSKLAGMFALKNKLSNYQVLQDIIDGKEQMAYITAQYSLEKRFDKNDFLSLLFYLGYLTIDSFYAGMVKLKVPNYVVKELYFSFFEKILEEEYKYELDVSNIQMALARLATEGDNTMLITCIETVLRSMSNRDSIKMDEKYIKTVCFTLCMLSKCYLVESENEAGKGYTDIQLMKRPGIDVAYYAVIEFKYLSKSDGKKENIVLKLDEARNQLIRYHSSPKFKEMERLKMWAVVFVQDECVRNEEI